MPIVNTKKRGLLIPKIGDIRKGIKVPVIDRNTNKPKIGRQGEIVTYPKEVDYFVLNMDKIEAKTIQRFKEVYGEEPQRINCFLASHELNRTWDAWYEAYTYNGLIARSDGAFVHYLFDVDTQEKLITDMKVIAKSSNPNSAAGRLVANLQIGDTLPHEEGLVVSQVGSKVTTLDTAVGRLGVIIPELGRHAYLTVHTGGRYGDVPHITEMVERIMNIARQIDRAPELIPFTLARVAVERKYSDADGNRKKRVGYDIQMEISEKIFSGLLQAYADSPIALLAAEPPTVFAAPSDDYIEEDEGYLVEVIEEPLQIPPVSESQEASKIDDKPQQAGRPYAPDIVKKGIANKVKEYTESNASVLPNDYKVLASVLNDTLGDKTKRYELCNWLVGVSSVIDMTPAQIKALRDWQGTISFGEMPSDAVLSETRSCHTEALKASGQKELI